MRLSDRFLNLLQQQLNSYESEESLENLALYVAQVGDGESPSLEAIAQWPSTAKSLPPVEEDLDLRAPSSDRRWYPLQDGPILLGVLRAERSKSNEVWSDHLDRRLQATAVLIAECLSLELDRRRLLDEFNQQSERISLMVHQLRNPLAALRTYAQLLLRKLGPESHHRSLVEGLLSEQLQLNKYVSALDQLAKSKETLQAINPSPLLLPPVLPKTASLTVRSLLEPLFERAEVKATLQGREWKGPNSWPNWTNNEQFGVDGLVAEIVANLLENAFNYSPAAASIGLVFSEKGLCVWDNGPPISKEEGNKIFQKGFRGKSSQDKIGSGLGLTLARDLARQMQGTLELNISPSTFSPLLPKIGNAFVLILPIK